MSAAARRQRNERESMLLRPLPASPPPPQRHRLPRPVLRARRRGQLRARSNRKQRLRRRMRRQRHRRDAPRQAPTMRSAPEPHRPQLGARPPHGKSVGERRMRTGHREGTGLTIAHAGAGLQRHRYGCELPPCVQQRTRRQRQRLRAAGRLRRAGAFPVAWTETASTGVEAFTIHTGVVVNGAFQPRTSRSTSPTHAAEDGRGVDNA